MPFALNLDAATLVPLASGLVLLFGVGAAVRWLRADRARRQRVNQAAKAAAALTPGLADDAAAVEQERRDDAGINQLEEVAADSLEALPIPGLKR